MEAMIDHVLGRPSVQFRKIQVLAVVSFWSFYLHRYACSISCTDIVADTLQRRPPWPAAAPAHLVAAHDAAHRVADGAHHDAVPLRGPQLRQARGPRVPGAARVAVLALLLPRHMGHHGAGRGLLVGHEDQAQGPARPPVHRLQRLLPHLRRAGRREGPQDPRHPHRRPPARRPRGAARRAAGDRPAPPPRPAPAPRPAAPGPRDPHRPTRRSSSASAIPDSSNCSRQASRSSTRARKPSPTG